MFEEFFSMRDIMDRMLGDLQTGDDLLIRVNRDRSFQESFSGLTSSPGLIMTGVRTGESG